MSLQGLQHTDSDSRCACDVHADCLATLFIVEPRIEGYPVCPDICTLLLSVIITADCGIRRNFCKLIKTLILFNTLKFMCILGDFHICAV